MFDRNASLPSAPASCISSSEVVEAKDESSSAMATDPRSVSSFRF